MHTSLICYEIARVTNVDTLPSVVNIAVKLFGA